MKVNSLLSLQKAALTAGSLALVSEHEPVLVSFTVFYVAQRQKKKEPNKQTNKKTQVAETQEL